MGYYCPHCKEEINDPSFAILGQTMHPCGSVVDLTNALTEDEVEDLKLHEDEDSDEEEW